MSSEPFTITINTLCRTCQQVVLDMMHDKSIIQMDLGTVKRKLCKDCLKKFRRAKKYYDRISKKK